MAFLVDEFCTTMGVLVHENYSCVLNLADVQKNSNKFYILQLLVSSDKKSFFVYSRYGRVGEKGVSTTKQFVSVDATIKEFINKYKLKTGCVWGSKTNNKPGKYANIEIEVLDTTLDIKQQNVEIQGSVLDEKIQKMIEEMVDRKSISKTFKLFNIDEKKLPLGKISSQQIQKANTILKDIEDNIKLKKDVTNLSSEFWTLVPYATGRNKPPPIIGTLECVKSYADFLDMLKNLQVTSKIINLNIKEIYDSLGLELVPLDRNSLEWSIIEKYVSKTHGITHNYVLELEEIIEIKEIDLENKIMNSPKTKRSNSKNSNSCLLFHGSRTFNFIGILKEGLRIPGLSQVVNGAALGRGIYFADCVTKSFNYCSDTQGYILLSEVNLGENPDFVNASCTNINNTFTSKIAEGRYTPKSDEFLKIHDVIVPCGTLIESTSQFRKQSSFIYNEYVIYNQEHYKPKYLLKLKKK